ncbi:MAG: proteasome subunit alpha [Acidimicrobiaceae bacterium]|nr:proteasome subunit alpha [Acidimicrobiaceae bacterium]
MSMPFYVSPEQMMEDRADYARKGISRGKALIALSFKQGILIVAENPSNTLHKVSEIYDRIAFAGVGKYNEFDQLRIAGVRHADLKGYSFSREDVGARNLANEYAQMLGQIFTHEMKPMEVEILVAEISHESDDIQSQMFHIFYDGTVKDETDYVVLGGQTEAITDRFAPNYKKNLTLTKALALAVNSLAGDDRELLPDDLEVAELSVRNGRRAFRRIAGDELDKLLS